ncbi:serine hydrolase domain-containing protein [Actinoplanes sp. NPDC024001]|uniref:serine hydrolase domain-containing protein n=1 Tax=Actinoplanes sp. NPDC024001 TaxID=3154598 RepID=UPI0033F9617E
MSEPMSRRTLLGATAGAAAAATLLPSPATAARTRVPRAVRELDEKIQQEMAAYAVPGVAYGLHYRGVDYVRGFGVTSLDDPQPVDADTVFRVASTTKPFTGTAIMRLVERGRLDLDRTVRSYLPGFRTADPAQSARVTVRQALNHSAGWLGDFFLDTGSDDEALARYVAEMSRLPQLTRPGKYFSYNNAAISLAGRLIEVATGRTYEQAIRELLTAPLGQRHSAFTLDEIPGVRWAVPHVLNEAQTEIVPLRAAWAMPRSINPAGGLISSARDQLRWARFSLGDGRVPGSSRRLLGRRSMHAMQSNPGPGGTLFVELDGAGVTWMLRPTAEGPTVVQHGGDWTGQHSGFLMVPERDFALTVLTNSDTGTALLDDLFVGDWALSRFAGVHNLPARPRALPAAELEAYRGVYTAEQIGFDGTVESIPVELIPDAGQLLVRYLGTERLRLAFYRKDYVVMLALDGTVQNQRANFVRDRDGSIGWLRFGGRLHRRGEEAAASQLRSTAPAALPRPLLS